MITYNVREFTKSELKKYLDILNIDAHITLGLFDDFGIEMKLAEPYFDDAIAISIKDKKGYIAGSNERSILMGVYRLFDEWGVRFVRPGKDGTSYPDKCSAQDVEILEAASKRHRTMCIEGALTIKNVTDMIDWMPKVGFNGYYIQFAKPYVFFERWFNHRENEYKKHEAFDDGIIDEYYDIMICELKKRGLLINTMGHGWTTAPFGIAAEGWYQKDSESFPQEYKDICALVNGKRDVWDGTPIQTQLCYSNPYVKKTMANAVIDYVHTHPYVDVVHFWTGDYFNNTCECPECSKGTVADHVIAILNEITDTLVKEGLKTKIAFAIGYNSLHPTKINKIRNLENVILDFAPITRSYSQSFPKGFNIKQIPPYKINNFKSLKSVDENLSYLYNWQKVYGGDCVDFDYHLMWDHILDAGGEAISKIIHQDLQNMESLGFNGFISCQLQRNAFPTSLAMTIMAKTLWNSDTDFEKTRRTLYAATFGNECVDELCNYFSTLSDAFEIDSLRARKEYDQNAFRANMEKAVALMESFGNTIEANKNKGNDCQKASWKYLEYHQKAYLLVGKGALKKLDQNEEEGKKYIDAAIEYILRNEDEIQPVLDAMFFRRMIRSRIVVIKQEDK